MIDDCTAWPDRFGGVDWSACCAAHDRAYDMQAAGKLAADLDLVTCVAAIGGWPLAIVMGAGVVLFGLPFWIRAQRRKQVSQ